MSLTPYAFHETLPHSHPTPSVMVRSLLIPTLLLLMLMAACQDGSDADPAAAADAYQYERPTVPAYGDSLVAEAERLAREALIVDGHIDVPYRLFGYDEDLSQATPLGDFDHPRAAQGGLDVPFMSIYIPVDVQDDYDAARARADSLIDRVERMAEEAPERFARATSPAEARANAAEGLVSLPMGLENGAPIGEDLSALQHFYDRGIRYVTLAHAEDNQFADSSYDTTRTHGGLSVLGRELVREMNRLGVIVDVSHITDAAAEDVFEITRAPVLATHSSVRAFTPGWERNMSDALIRRLGENGGVIMISFGSSFLANAYREQGDSVRALIDRALEGVDRETDEGRRAYAEQRKAYPLGSVTDVADHVDHVVELVGIDHVGLGSDFDGVFALPAGLQDASGYPTLVAELLQRGYTEEDLRKILGGNAMRVWEAVEQAAE